MMEILLFGLVVVVVYFISHHAVMAIERRHGKPLGGWRSAWFFLIFLGLVIAAQLIMRALTGG
ncbi:hypothetical protein IC757_16055 [Wenzhouxiangella sp. AB-CW3]|uniref:hypothetical protein n=1 Tax=Wenzhouxiangella sp. AB-CW3 TaxID=2771012 RepID=UPI00168B00AE|nr:hypothetical protein [Wenzhouxiangella sp. AB-CW3]QOC22497.1 hypothetical protein IC757_16055 [Wenzhouxiangella sp. AB-CW3]